MPEDGAMKLAEFWPMWQSDVQARLAGETVALYQRCWNGRIEPRFGHMSMRDITPRAVSQWRAELQRAGIGPEAIRKAMMVLQNMFSVAIEWGEATTNPVSVVRKPRQGRRRTIEVLSPQDVERVRRWLLDRGDRYSATLVSVLAYTGTRPGEALGLEGRHLRQETLLVEQANADGKLKLQKTSRVYRTVDLLDAPRADLTAWISDRHSAGAVFARSDGEFLRRTDWNNWRNRRFYAACEACGLGRPRPYDLRHSFASLLIREQKTSIVELAQQLGHSPTETLKTYGHVFAEYRRQQPVPADDWIAQARREVHGA